MLDATAGRAACRQIAAHVRPAAQGDHRAFAPFSAQVLDAMDAAAKVPKPPLSDMFTDVYAGPALPWHLEEQYKETLAAVQRHPELKPSDMPLTSS